MKEYDLIVLGSGAGMNLASTAFEQGLKVAVVENGPLGGTCLNRGCIPTKMLTYVADVIMEMQHAEAVNLKARVEEVDFKGLMERMRHETVGESEQMGRSVQSVEGLDWYHVTGEFVEDYTMKVGDETIRAPYIFIAAGSRPVIPPIKGLDDVGYLTNKTVLELTEQPKSMIIVGGGYVAAEFGHFFSAIGTEVTIVGRNQYLVKNEDHDVSELLKEELSKRMVVLTNHEVTEASEKNGLKAIVAKNRDTGELVELSAETLLIAAGRRSNADLFKPEKTGVETDKRGYVIVDDHFQTTKKHIWAFGDAIGRYMFRHTANEESEIVWYNFAYTLEAERTGKEPKLLSMDYHAIPRAVFSYPQIATVGMTLSEAKESGRELLVGEIDYSGSAKGMAMGVPPGFLRVICDAKSRRILGSTIIGPHAPILIQEIVNLMNCGDGTYVPMFKAIHIHPALPELVQRAFGRMRPLNEDHEHAH
ncbi:MAG: dihydrolipoyl dehydrogenase [Candidatus Thorarchaeota archaeon]|nr:dihydrolipoyl dehydrogenase [Candidatus Thorarchaeota archaeon]